MCVSLLPVVFAGWVLWAAPVGDLGTDRAALAGRDFTLLHFAGLLARAGDILSLYDPAALTALLRATYGPSMPAQIWPYPPTALLLALPASLPPLPLAFVTYCALGLALLACAGRRRWPLVLLLSPAVAENALAGQNGAVISACLAAGLFLLGRRPVLAGALLAGLVLKPQMAVLLPVVLLAGRQWRSLAACGATGLATVAATVALFGVEPWVRFLEAQAAVSAYLTAPWQATSAQTSFCSLFMAARSLGATVGLAFAVQALGTATAAALVARAWSARNDRAVNVALTLAATAVACPWIHAYDLPVAAVAVLLLHPAASGWQRAVLGANWVWPGLQLLLPVPVWLSALVLASLLMVAVQQSLAICLTSRKRGATCVVSAPSS